MITAAQADFLLEDIKGSHIWREFIPVQGGLPESAITLADIEKFILENAERECIITQGQGQHLLDAIETNFQWVADKGCTVTDTRKFIENIIRKMAGVEKWAGEDAVA